MMVNLNLTYSKQPILLGGKLTKYLEPWNSVISV